MKQFILEITASVFNAKGYKGASINDLMNAKGISKGSINGNYKKQERSCLAAFDYIFFVKKTYIKN